VLTDALAMDLFLFSIRFNFVYTIEMSTDVLNARKKIVGVLRGGPSHQYDVSLKSGSHVLQNLSDSYQGQDIFITRDGEWHIGGVRRDPEKILRHVDVVWNALHGQYGEDGKVQQILSTLDVPYTGSEAFSSALAMNKHLTRKVLLSKGMKMPIATVILPKENTYKNLFELFRTFPQPSIIKPISGGSSVGITVAHRFEDFKKGIEKAFHHGSNVLIEEYIRGKEITCIVIDESNQKGAYALFPIEITSPTKNYYFDYDLKYINPRAHICPSSLSNEEKLFIQNRAVDAHQLLGLRHYSSADFIVSPQRGTYLLEVNTLPGLAETSLLPQVLLANNTDMREFIDHILSLALKK